MGQKLPGTAVRRRKGRQETAIDKLATELRRDGPLSAASSARVTAARMLARSMDDIERRDDGGGHTLAMLSKSLRDYVDDLAPVVRLDATSSVAEDPYDEALRRILDGVT